jgi:hypothetical protein
MRVLSGISLICGITSLYFGAAMLLFFSGEADGVKALLIKISLVTLGALLLSASGWLWFRARQLDRRNDPQNAAGQALIGLTRRRGVHMAAFISAGFLLVGLVYLCLLNR